MRVRVRLFHTLAKHAPEGTTDFFWLDLPDGATVDGLILRLGIPQDLTSLTFIDGKQSRFTSALREGASVMLIPPVPGG